MSIKPQWEIFIIKNPERNVRMKLPPSLAAEFGLTRKKENTNLRFYYSITNNKNNGSYVSFREVFRPEIF
jgi:hypothetical protein